MKRIICWTIGLALLGAALGSKGPTIGLVDVLTGSLWGAFAGVLLGSLFNKLSGPRSTEQKRKIVQRSKT